MDVRGIESTKHTEYIINIVYTTRLYRNTILYIL